MPFSLSHEEIVAATRAKCVREGSLRLFDSVMLDTRKPQINSVFVALTGEQFDGHRFLSAAVKAGARAVVVERGANVSLDGVEATVFEVASTLFALGDLARLHRRRFSVPVGAVTGSNGKTTTKELVAAILQTRGPALKTQGNLNNEGGVPLTLFQFDDTHRSAVIEMGMNHLGEIDRLAGIAKPDAGLITVVQPAHLEGVGSIEGVAEAKTELFRRLSVSGVAVVNLDDHRIVERSKGLRCQTLTFGRSPEAQVRLTQERLRGARGQSLTISFNQRSYEVELQLLGRHNALNATGAFALGCALGFSPEACAQGLSTATSHSQRLQLKTGLRGLQILDDCYNANPESMIAAIDTLLELSDGKPSVAILGDMFELGAAESEGHASVVRYAIERVGRVVLLGERMKRAAAANAHPKLRWVDDLSQLAPWIASELSASDTILVKASRGMKLERVVSLLLSGVGSEGSGH